MISLDSFKICAAALVAAICFFVVRRVNASFDIPMRLAAAVVFWGVVLGISLPVFSYLSELVCASELNEWQGIIFGAVGIAMLSHAAAELCRDCGEGGLAGFVELAGKMEILLLCLPLVKELVLEVQRLVG